MTNQVKVTGIVLSSTPIGEYDRRVVLLTKERGKITAFARGARRPNNILMGATGTFTFGKFFLYEGRTSYSLVSAEVENYFSELREDVEGAYYGLYFLELASHYGREGNDETETLKLVYQGLRGLLSSRIPNPLVRVIYEWKMITIHGEGPQVFSCVSCGKEEKISGFHIRRGGLICEACKKAETLRSLHPSTIYTLQFILSTPIEKVYTFLVTPKVQEELEDLVESYFEVYVGKQFQTLEILKVMLGGES